jgi:hypothetical protein
MCILVDLLNAGYAQQGQAAGVVGEFFTAEDWLWFRAACHDQILAGSLFVRYWSFCRERGQVSLRVGHRLVRLRLQHARQLRLRRVSGRAAPMSCRLGCSGSISLPGPRDAVQGLGGSSTLHWQRACGLGQEEQETVAYVHNRLVTISGSENGDGDPQPATWACGAWRRLAEPCLKLVALWFFVRRGVRYARFACSNAVSGPFVAVDALWVLWAHGTPKRASPVGNRPGGRPT